MRRLVSSRSLGPSGGKHRAAPHTPGCPPFASPPLSGPRGGSAPVDALRQWVDRLAQYAMTKHGLAPALGSATSSDAPLYAETYDLIAAALARPPLARE